MKNSVKTLAACLLALVIIAPGCSRKQTEVAPGKSPGSVKVKEISPKPIAKKDADPKETPLLNAIIEEQTSVPAYPGSKQQGDFSSGMDDQKNKVLMVSFATEDSLDEVMAFYRKTLKGYTETDIKIVNGARVGGFRRSAGRDSELIVIEEPKTGPVKIAMTVTKAPQGKDRR